MTLPFQAVECLMGNITPLQGEDFCLHIFMGARSPAVAGMPAN